MKIKSLYIENFKAVRKLSLSDLPQGIVIAGPNGCGKSSLFDAIKLLKSAYGQYFDNEFKQFFGEFQIDINKLELQADRFLNDVSKPMRIKAEFCLTEGEQTYLSENAKRHYQELNWSRVSGHGRRAGGQFAVDPATRRNKGQIVVAQAEQMAAEVQEELKAGEFVAELHMMPGEGPAILPSSVIELMFSVYEPEALGILDYHAPSRTYDREQIGGINLRIEDQSQRNSQHALYNTKNKYTGVKTEMAQSYVRQILAKEAGVELDEKTDLKSTLNELFSVFFPGKKFLGAVPTKDGGLEFPVELENGRRHDINDLSSGEKEVLLGYLRLRNNAPRNSILLLDEPELHLNPRLARGLPSFYQKHLGDALGNQLFMVTHSDAILREAVQEPTYAVYHMQSFHKTADDTNQVSAVSASAELEQVIIDLVGDLATYNPRSKVVILEGESSDFDVNFIRELFPEFAEKANLISAGSKQSVKSSHALLEKAGVEGRLDARFYSIVDRDLGQSDLVKEDRQYVWDVYHIENFLLNPKYILEAINSLNLGATSFDEESIKLELQECASDTLDELVRIRLRSSINKILVNCISVDFDPKLNAEVGFSASTLRSCEKINKVVKNELSEKSIKSMVGEVSSTFEAALKDDRWMEDFRGRNILKRFVGKNSNVLNCSYEIFRNLIINRMRDDGYRPPGMTVVLNKIMEN